MENTLEDFIRDTESILRFFSQPTSGTPTLGGRRGSCPICPHPWGAGGARISLHDEPWIEGYLIEGGTVSRHYSTCAGESFFFLIKMWLIRK